MSAPASKPLRILVLPVKNRTWAFHVEPTGVAGGSTAGGLTLGGLWKSLKLAGSTQERADILDEWGTQKAHNQWTALEKAPAKSVKGRIAGWGNALMRRAHPGEQFLKSIPRDAGEVEIIYPAGVTPKLVRRRVRLLARRGQELHKCWTYVTAGALPFTSLLSILPLPNVVLFYNLFRAHANWHAWKGGDTLMRALAHPTPTDGLKAGSEQAEESPATDDVRTSPGASLGASESPESSNSERSNPSGATPESPSANSDASSPSTPPVSDPISGDPDCNASESEATASTSDASKRDSNAAEASKLVNSLRFGRIAFCPSKDLAELARTMVDSRGIPVLATLGDERIERLSEDFGLDQPLILKWRDTGT